MSQAPQPAERLPLSGMRARGRALVCCLLGLVAGVIASLWISRGISLLVGWDIAVIVYLVWVWTSIRPLDAERTARVAAFEDDTRTVTDLVLLSASVASLAAVGFVLVRAGHSRGEAQSAWVALGLVSVTLSWAIVHTTYTLRYARLYYTGSSQGVDFNQPEPPTYLDFAYLAFTIGMAYQVSDTPLRTSELRRTALRHAMLSYVLGTGVLATTINLIANLSG